MELGNEMNTQNNTEYLLELDHITRRFIAVTALKDVCLKLRHGEVLAVCGENGAGKSTLMKILSGSDSFGNYEGTIRVNGQPMRFRSTKDAENAGIEMIYQEISLHLDLTVAENLFMGALPMTKWRTIDWRRMNREAKDYLQMVGLQVDPRQKVKTLSTSQQQLLSIARAIAKKPKILVLDEPTSALTQTETENLLRVIRDLKAKQVSCLYISHKMDEIFQIADRVTVLRDGEHIADYPTSEVTPEKLVEDMVGRKIEVLYPKQQAVIGEEILRVENMCVPHPYMKDRNIVDDVSFSLRRGEILGIAGLVGAGRSELLNAIFKAQEEGVSGKVWLEGKRIDKLSLRGIKEAGIGYLTEDRKRNGFIAGATIRENTVLASLDKIVHGGLINHRAEKQYANDYFQKLSVKAPDIETPMIHLSGGNQQKVVLAKWMMTDLKVMFFDEPTRGIDVGAKTEIYRLISDMANQGIGIIMVSSEMPELIAMCDRFLVLSNGKFRAELTGENVSQEKIMKAATLVEEN